MPARVDDDAVRAAAEALLAAASTIKSGSGLKLKPIMDLAQAKQHVMCALVYSLGHYAHTLQPTGWTELASFGDAPPS